MASDLDHRTDRLAILAAMIMLNPAAAVSKGLAAKSASARCGHNTANA